MTNKKLWGGRFQSQTHQGVEQFLSSVHFDATLAPVDILGSLAHADMLAHCQIISAEECTQLQQGLQTIAQKIAAEEAVFSSADEDVHMNIERMLTERVGAVAGKLHTARSRNDQVALDTHLYLRQQVLQIADLLTQLQSTLREQAAHHQTVILPGYTHLQRAQPVRLSHHFLAYIAMFHRDCDRLIHSWSRINQSPLGAAALAGTRFKIDPAYLAQTLGFEGTYTNSMDAVSDRDFVIEFLAHAALIMMHVSRLSEELVLWSSQEFSFIHLEDGYATGSSIMPQKKNPDVPELARGKTGRVYGALMSVLTTMKGLPLAYNKDMQEDKEPLFDAVTTLKGVLGVFVPMLKTMHVHTDKMHAGVIEGFLNATDLADYLAQKGIPFRAAHRITGEMVAYCIQKKCHLEQLSLPEMQQFSPEIAADIYTVISAENMVEARGSQGGTALDSVRQQLATAQEKITAQTAWLVEKENLLEQVNKRFFRTSD
jgi:argininosuccinate lyase